MTKLGWGGKFRRWLRPPQTSHDGSFAASRNSVFWKSVLAIAKFTVGITAFISPAFAQSNIVPDNTLSSEASRVIFNFNGTPNEVIGGGAQRGQNLFHSFREFNVSAGRGAYFFVFDPNIQNILARVTGSNRSDILGTLGTRQVIDGNFFRSNANLFLMNPNGIIFGENARLDVGASFVATTANGIQFGNQGSFSVSGGQPSQVLTINPSAFFFNQINAAPIVNQSRAKNISNPSFTSGLQVGDGRSLVLLGGSVNLDGGALGAYDGRIELGGLAGIGTVGLNVDGNNLDLNFPTDVAKADISFSNRSSVNTSGIGGGEIKIHGNNVTLSGKSGISSNTFGNQNGKGIFIEAKQLVLNDSGIFTRTNTPANSGDIKINSQSLNLQNGALVSTDTAGEGKAGNLTVTARDSINITGVNALPNSPFLPSLLLSFTVGSGAAGDIRIVDTGRINIEDGGQILATTGGQGRAGNIDITADNVQLVGTSANQQFRSAIVSESSGSATSANSGDITITTRLLSVLNGAGISTISSNQGKAGNLTVKASESLKINGTGVQNNEVVSSALSTQALSFGAAGNIKIFETELVEIKNGGKISTSTSGQGRGGNMDISADKIELKGVAAQGLFRSSLESRTTGDGSSARAGDITLKTRILNVTDAALISTTTFNSGQGGDINLTAQESMVFSGTGTFFDGQAIRSGLSLQTNNSGTGGNLKIFNTGTVRVQNGALISTITSGQGNAGNIDIDADTVEIEGISSDYPFRSELSTSTINTNSSANAGNTNIKTRILNVRDGGLIRADTENSGKGGNLTISASESMNFTGTATLTENRFVRSGLSLQASGSGYAGNLRIFDTGAIQVKDGALISTTTIGQGNAGNVDISAGSLDLLGFSINNQFRSGLGSETINQNSIANAADITIKTRNLNIRDGSFISTQTSNQGRGGNITVIASESLNIVGAGSGLSTSTSGLGAAGNIKIFETNHIIIDSGGRILASSTGFGQAGNIEVNADTVDLIGVSDNNQFISTFASETSGKDSIANSGDITVTSRLLSIRDGADISTRTFNQGRGGNLTINARESLNIFGTGTQNGRVVGSGLFTETSASGAAGNLRIIDTGRIRIEGGGTISASNRGQGRGGNIEINADTLEIFGIASNGQFVSAIGSETTGANSSTDAGDITITAINLNIRERGLISTRSFNQGKAGNININVDKTLNLTNGNILTFSRQSSGGSVNVNAENIRLFGDSNISTSVVSGAGGGGDIKLTADSILAFGDSDIFAFAQDGKGGNITFDTPAFFGQNYRPAPPSINPLTLEENNRVDINASGAVSGVVVLPDTGFVQNNLGKLPQTAIDTNALIANSCIARRNQQQNGSFFITGSGGLPLRPGDASLSSYSTGDVQPIPAESTTLPTQTRPWKIGDPVIEPSGVYELPNGKLVLGKEC